MTRASADPLTVNPVTKRSAPRSLGLGLLAPGLLVVALFGPLAGGAGAIAAVRPAGPGNAIAAVAGTAPASGAAPSGGTITCSSDIAKFGPIKVSRVMAAHSSGFLQLGWPTGTSTNRFIGNCVLTGAIPAGWTVAQASFVALSATAGSANEGTWELGTDDTKFTDPGTFTNSGRVIDNSDGFTQELAVGTFVNTGTLVSDATGFTTDGPAAAPPCGCKFVDDGTIEVGAKDAFSSGGVFVLNTGAHIAGPGAFDIANESTFEMAGGAAAGADLTTTQFLGRGPATIIFEAATPPGSTGTVAVTTNVNLEGVVPAHWVLDIAGGSIAARASGNAGTINWEPTVDGSDFVDAGTFANSGTFADDATGFSQQVQVARFVNTGRLVSAAPSFSVNPSSSSGPPPLLVDQGAVTIQPKASFSCGCTFDLKPAGRVFNHGEFDFAGMTLNAQGGSLLGVPVSNPYHLGAQPSRVNFFPAPPGSKGSLDIEIPTTIAGVVPAGWLLDVTGGGLTAGAGSGNRGTVDWAANTSLGAIGSFTNWGTINTSGFSFNVTAGNFVNAANAHLIANGPASRVAVTGNFSNSGSVLLGPAAVLSTSQSFTQAPSGRLGVAVSAASTYGAVKVSGAASLRGALAIDKLPSYIAHAGDTQEIVSAASVRGAFHPVTGTRYGGGLIATVSYGAQTAVLTVGKG